MKLSASNIGWSAAEDERVWQQMKQLGYTGLEIAPTRIFHERPYDNLPGAALFAGVMWQKYGFSIPSMQSIWYGQTESIFEPGEAAALADYTAQALEFAYACHCPSLVFGCPRNRSIPEGHTAAEADGFFEQLAYLAQRRGAVIALEANPPMYNTNFLNTHKEVFALAKRLDRPGLAVNLDVGAMVANGETAADVAAHLHRVSHVHISEPGLAPIQPRPLHRELALLLKGMGYQGFVSLEMKAAGEEELARSLEYVAEVFG